jgi:hypothetical protein
MILNDTNDTKMIPMIKNDNKNILGISLESFGITYYDTE